MAPPHPSSVVSPGPLPFYPPVTEDTPPDFLEGMMELLVVLPTGRQVSMNVDRRTPIMDLLIQLGTMNKFNPGDHIVQVRNERGIELPYKPSTPIGALDTSTIEIVPKNRVNEYIIVKKPTKVANQPFEHTFRLQVHLPRNQLYVMRVTMKTLLGDILKEVCLEKQLCQEKYEIRHPGNLEERLSLGTTVGEFGLQEITVVSKNTKISSSVSSADIMALQREGYKDRGKSHMDASFTGSRSSVGGSSESGSSGSGESPINPESSSSVLDDYITKSRLRYPSLKCTSDVIRSVPFGVTKSSSMFNMSSSPSPPGVVVAPPRQKKRAAPLPPPLRKTQTEAILMVNQGEQTKPQLARTVSANHTPKKKEAPRVPSISPSPISSAAGSASNHSRHSSGNSGCTDYGAMQHNNRIGYDSRQISIPESLTGRPPTNLTTTSSLSSSSLASSSGGSSKKRKAPLPPSTSPSLKPQTEIDEEEGFGEVSSVISEPTGSPDLSNSVQVEVDVHYHRQNSLSRGKRSPISVNTCKEEDGYSSGTPASSLSSPGSYVSTSISPTPSPLPRSEFHPHSTVEEEKSTEQICFPSPSPEVSGHAADMGTDALDQDDGSKASVPMPPPRTKPRKDSNEDLPVMQAQPQPIPRPRPRPDRKSVDDIDIDVSKRDSDSSLEKEEVAPQTTSGLRNPLSKYGVKVLPDNVLKERAERLSALAASSVERDQPPRIKGHAPSPRTSSDCLVKPPLPPSSKNSAFQSPRNASDDEVEEVKSKSRKGRSSEEDYDDDLEENIELFEPDPRKMSTESNSAGQRQQKVKGKAPPVPTHHSSVDRSSASDLEELKKKSTNANPTNRPTSEGPDASESDKMLNRWQNSESLHEFDDSKKSHTNKLSTGSGSQSSNAVQSNLDKSVTGSKPASSLSEDNTVTSSESDSDSGVPPTTTVTPSPLDFDEEEVRTDSEHEESHGLKDEKHLGTEDKESDKNAHDGQGDIPSSEDEKQSSGSEKGQSDRSSSDQSARRLSKSESFSHTSEFDMAQMKRKKFGNAGRQESRRSSSEEDDGGWTSVGAANFKDQSDQNKTNSLRNLSKTFDKTEDKPERGNLQKHSSLLEVTPAELSSNPEVMKIFHSQLEAQFEKWKNEFIQKHAKEVEPEPEEDKKSVQNKVQEEQIITAPTPVVERLEKSPRVEPKNSPIEMQRSRSPPRVTITKMETSTRPVVKEELVTRRAESLDAEPKLKIVSIVGPPAVNMGHWNERPRSAVTVKKDVDYIMGFGQANPKTIPSEFHPSNKMTRTQSFNQYPANPMVKTASLDRRHKPIPESTDESATVTLRRDAHVVNPPPTTKGISVALNARPVSFVGTADSVSTVRSLLSTWKQRAEESETVKQRSLKAPPPPEIDMYGDSTSVQNSSPPDPIAEVETVKVEKVEIEQPSSTISESTTATPEPQPVDEEPVNVKKTKELFAVAQINDSPKTMPSKPTTFKVASLSRDSPSEDPPSDRKSITSSFRISSFTQPEKVASTVIVTPNVTSEEEVVLRRKPEPQAADTDEDSQISFKDRRSYFQGVQPCESPTKETPLPAVNMKGSIATIQKVFEQNKQRPQIEKSMTLPTKKANTEKSTDNITIVEAATQSPVPILAKPFESMSSAEMVQRVFGKSNRMSLDAFRRSPSPLSSTTSTLSRASSSGRETPTSTSTVSITVNNDMKQTSAPRITNEVKKPPGSSNIHNEGNKSIIIVNGSDDPSTPVSVRNNIFTMNNSKDVSKVGDKSESSGKVTVNGKTSSTLSPSQSNVQKLKDNPWVAELINKPTPVVTQNSEPSSKVVIKADTTNPPPPPPPMLPTPPPLPSEVSATRPSHLGLRPISATLSSPTGSTPGTPGSDPRNEIFNVIKNSNGNFGLKKTGSILFSK